MRPMRVLALEPYFGGSHRAFLEGWTSSSRHRWTLETLPPYKWKWRMRHGAVTLASRVAEGVGQGANWDVVWASDMLALAEFRGLVPPAVGALPTVLYMHENQLTYPSRSGEGRRDLHYAFSNLVSAFAADQVWFNSAFHRDELLTAADAWLRRMPDFAPLEALAAVRGKSRVLPQGIDGGHRRRPARQDGPLRIVWAARWEHDKNPEDFFAALGLLEERGVDFLLAILGESFRQVPEIFAEAEQRFAARTAQWGFVESRQDYLDWLAWGDVVVSTAKHEFFGISVVEAIAAGCVPFVPRRLAYPEILQPMEPGLRDACFYDGGVEGLVAGLEGMAERLRSGDGLEALGHAARDATRRFHWTHLRPQLDAALDELTKGRGSGGLLS